LSRPARGGGQKWRCMSTPLPERMLCDRATTAYRSETSLYRTLLAPHCAGFGIDIGFGGDAITDSAVRVDLPRPYANTGSQTVQLGGDCRDLRWFRDESLDFVYSSHVLEDFDERETEPTLREWVRVLKVGGSLALLLPDQQRYSRHCVATGQSYNEHHSIDHFSLDYVESVAIRIGNLRCTARYAELGPYSFGVVFEKIAGNPLEIAERDELRERLHTAWAERDELKLKLNRIERHPMIRTVRALHRALGAALRSVAPRRVR
jgi:SAM-dependent methyltransferase